MIPQTRLLVIVALAAVGCQTAPVAPDRVNVAAQLVPRFGQTLPDRTVPGQFTLPPGVNLDDGLSEDEALAVALWNNAAFQELLADLGIARGDLIQAGLLPNPEVVYYFGATDKPFKYLVDFPLEALWLRPMRVKAATGEAARTADRLSQAGLDLMRDVRQAYSDVMLAKARLDVAKKTVELRAENRKVVEKLKEQEALSEQDAAAARIQSLQAEQDATVAAYDVPIAEERLRNLLGFGTARVPLALDVPTAPPLLDLPVDQLTAEATATRPDATAAERAVAAAEARLRFAKLGWVRFLGLFDATSGTNGHEFAPAFRVTLPIFNWNQGAVARAEAELERAVRNRQTVQNQIVLDVQRAHLQYKQASAGLEALRAKVRPEVEANLARARKALENQDVSVLLVFEITRQVLDADLREAGLAGDLRRAWAELERGVGRRLSTPPTQNPTPAPTVRPSDAPKSPLTVPPRSVSVTPPSGPAPKAP